MARHAKLFGPSSRDTWAVCPGAPVLSEGIPSRPMEITDLGTAKHFLLATCLGSGRSAAEYLGRTIKVGSATSDDLELLDDARFSGDTPAHDVVRYAFPVDGEFVDHVQACLDMVAAICETDPDAVVFFEMELPATWLTKEEGGVGTVDVLIVLPATNSACLIDAKFGYREVPCDCRQLKMYGLLADEYLQSIGYDIGNMELRIAQPTLHFTPEPYLFTKAERVAELDIVARETNRVWELHNDRRWITLRDWSVLNPGEDQCRYCRRNGDCPGQDAVLQQEFEDLSPKAVQDATATLGPQPAEWLARKALAAPFVKAWAEAVLDLATQRALAGEDLPGCKLVQGRKGPRQWLDPILAEEQLKTFRAKREEMYTWKVISPTQAEKIYGPKGTAASTKRWNKLKTLVSQNEGSIKLVSADAKGDPIAVSAPAAAFDDVVPEVAAAPAINMEDFI